MRLVIFLFLILSFKGICASQCPLSTLEWNQKLEQLSSTLIPDLGNNSLYTHGPKLMASKNYTRVLKFWNKCSSKADSLTKKRYSNLIAHSKFMALAQKESHSGFSISDEDYLLNSLSINSSFAEFPKVFFKNNYLPKDWKDIIKSCKLSINLKGHALCHSIKDWKFMDFHSTLEDGSGKHRRIIVQVPYKNFQQYFLFFPDHPKHHKNKLVDIIALQTHEFKNHKKLVKPRPYFFERHNKGFAKDGGRCISCHSNGLREISPIQGSLIDKDIQKEIQKFNLEVRSFGRPDWQGVYAPEALGPALGGSCLKCHGGGSGINIKREPLTIFTNPALIRSKIYELEMPYSTLHSKHFELINHISDSESKELAKNIREIALKVSADEGKDYRPKESVREIRSKIHLTLFQNKKLTQLEYISLRAMDKASALHADYKVNFLFSDFKKNLKHWLMGEKFINQ